MSRVDQSFGAKRTAKVVGLAREVGWLAARGKKQQAAEALVLGMYQLGGIYVKFLQILTNLMPDFPGLNHSLKNIIYDSPSYQEVDILQALSDNYQAAELARFSKISPTPFASGSFAQVYEATLDGDKEVIIKVLRPHIKRQLKTDLRLLAILARTAQPLVKSGVISTAKLYKDYKQTVRQEVDYKTEVMNALHMADYYHHVDSIVVPTTYPELCSQRIIVQEKLNGIPLSEVIEYAEGDGLKAIQAVKEELGSDIVDQLSELGYQLIGSSIEGPKMYGDPHPGNIILLPDSKIGLIDFGVLLPQVKNPDDLYAVMYSEGQMHYDQTGSFDLSDHALKMFKLYNPIVYRALEKVDKETKELSILKELKTLIDKVIEPSKSMLRDSYERGLGVPSQAMMQALDGGAGQVNRFNFSADQATARIARAQSQMWNAIEQLGIIRETSIKIHEKLDEKFLAAADTLRTDAQLSYGDATEILTDWFTGLVERDPLLFGGLFAKIRKTLQDKEQEPSNA